MRAFVCVQCGRAGVPMLAHAHARTHTRFVCAFRWLPFGARRSARIAHRLAVRPVCRPRTSSRTRAAPVRDISRPQTASESRHRPTVAGSADALEPHLVRPAPARMPTSGLLMHWSRRLLYLLVGRVKFPFPIEALRCIVACRHGGPHGEGTPLR